MITNTEKEYENLAIELAIDPNKLNKIKDKLEKNRLTKPLFDVKLFTKNIETTYKIMHNNYLSNLPSDNIEI